MADDVLDGMMHTSWDIECALSALLLPGMQRWSRTSAGELEALAQVAHHARLVRVERQLIALRTSVDRYLDRDPDVHTQGLLDRVARLVFMLREVRRRGAVDGVAGVEDVVGRPRRSYDDVDVPLLVVPVSLRVWRTDSDFIGVTTTFWSPSMARRLEGSIARPCSAFGNDPRRLALQWLSDAMALTLQELSHGAWWLEGVRLSGDGRLGFPGSAVAREGVSPVAEALEGLRCAGGAEVVERLASSWVDPLSEASPELVYVELKDVRRKQVDETHGISWCEALDHAGAALKLVVPMRPEHQTALKNLEALADPRSRPDGVVAEARLEGGQLVLRPQTAVFRQEVERRERRRVVKGHLVHLGVEDLSGVDR